MGKSEILTIQEVADILKVSASSVRGLIKRRELPAYKVGRGWRIKAQDVERFCDANCITSDAAQQEQYALSGKGWSYVLISSDGKSVKGFQTYWEAKRFAEQHNISGCLARVLGELDEGTPI